VGSKKFSFTRVNTVENFVVSPDSLGRKLYFLNNGVEAGFNFVAGELGEKDPNRFLQGRVPLTDGDKGSFFAQFFAHGNLEYIIHIL